MTIRGLLEAIERPEDQFDWYQALLLADEYINLQSTRQWAIERICRVVQTQLDTQAYDKDRDCNSQAAVVLESGRKQIAAKRRERETAASGGMT